MSPIREEESYAKRVEYLRKSRTTLANYKKMYPDLSFTRINPKQVALTILKDFVRKYEEELLAETAYLEPEEQDLIVIGSVHATTNKRKHKRLNKMFDKAKEQFNEDLEQVIELGVINITMNLLRLQELTAKFTSGRINRQLKIESWVSGRERIYREYHINEAKKYSASKDLDLKFAYSANDIPEQSGIYFLFKDGELIYIGHSSNLNQRLLNHDIVRKSYLRDGDNGYIMDCVYCTLPIEKAKSIEWSLIEIARPKYNTKGK
jgi:hypothetical protein